MARAKMATDGWNSHLDSENKQGTLIWHPRFGLDSNLTSKTLSGTVL